MNNIETNELIKQFGNNLGGARGGSTLDDILEFDPPTDPTNPLTGKWKKVATMKKKRYVHAVSVVKFDSDMCN